MPTDTGFAAVRKGFTRGLFDGATAVAEYVPDGMGQCRECGCYSTGPKCEICGATFMSDAERAAAMLEAALSNALVGQKDAIVRRIDAALTSAHLRAAYDYLIFALPLWNLHGYAYKGREITDRIKERAGLLLQVEENTCRETRAGTRARRKSTAEIGDLENLIAVL